MREATQKGEWDEYVQANLGHPLQLWGWGDVKSAHGWTADRVFVLDDDSIIGAVQILTRKLPSVFKAFSYIPRGPVGDRAKSDRVLDSAADFVRNKYHSVAVSVDPEWASDDQTPKGWRKTKNTILIADTVLLDLTKTEDELLAVIDRKRRYDIRKSTKDITSLRVAVSDPDIEAILDLYDDTARRAGFDLHGRQYYRDIHAMLGDASVIAAAYDEKSRPIAFVWLAVSDRIAFELYGGINESGHKLRANYGLKWWAITEMKRRGVKSYDINGLLNDGINSFKLSFTDRPTHYIGTLEKPLSPLYSAWNHALPWGKKIIRAVRRK